jgi:hypothetical protein
MVSFGGRQKKGGVETCIHATKHSCDRSRGLKSSSAELVFTAFVVLAVDAACALPALLLKDMLAPKVASARGLKPTFDWQFDEAAT